MKRFCSALILVGFLVLTLGQAWSATAEDAAETPAQAADVVVKDLAAPAPVEKNNYNETGVALFNRGAFGDAIIEFNKQLEQNPEDVSALVNRGISFARRGEYKIAVENLFTALNIKNNDLLILKYIAAVYYLDREFEKSIEIYQKANVIANTDYEALAGKGCAYLALQKNNEATAEFTRALFVAPADIRSFIGRGMSLTASGKYKAAIADLSNAAASSAKNPFIYLVRADANAGNAGFTSAVADLGKSCSLGYGPVCSTLKKSRAEIAGTRGMFVLQYSIKAPDEELYELSRKKLDRFHKLRTALELRKYFIRQLKPLTL
jgi:tetratricopeptide (TPR) repeat protein